MFKSYVKLFGVLLTEGVKSPILIVKGAIVFYRQGLDGVKKKIREKYIKRDYVNEQYQLWLAKNFPTDEQLNKQKKEVKFFQYKPKISLITPTYNTSEEALKQCIDSVINQSYNNWELCLSDDASTNSKIRQIIKDYSSFDNRIKYIFKNENEHISKASNSALKLSTGEFVGLLDHDDFLWPNALFELVSVLNKNPKAELIYSDEDKITENGKKHFDPFFKPDWSRYYLRSLNYITHVTFIQKKLIDKVGAFREGFEGSQDWDLFLRITDEIEKKTSRSKFNQKKTAKIVHIPKVLYSWRISSTSTASNNIKDVKPYAVSNQKKTLLEDLSRKGLSGEVSSTKYNGIWHIKYFIDEQPLVSIIIPTKNQYSYIKRCLTSIYSKTTYKNFEIILVDTGSTDKEVHNLYSIFTNDKKNILLEYWKDEFNFSAVCNFGAEKAKGEYLLFLNNDTEVLSNNWIESLLELGKMEDVGAVGCKLLYPDGRIQHAGVVVGMGAPNGKGIAGHFFKYRFDKLDDFSKVTNIECIREFSAVTAACLLVSKRKFNEVNGFDPIFKIAFNDVDFNLKLFKKGYVNIYTPYSRLKHYESISVGKPGSGKRDLNLFKKEMNLMNEKWKDIIQRDPFYNENLSLDREDYYLKF